MRHLLVWIVVAAALAAGCSSDEPETLAALSEKERAELSMVDYAALKARLEAQKGKLVVLAAWSVRQEGGVELHAALAGLAARGSEQGLAVVALNLDALDDVRDKVLPALREQRPAFSSCVFDGDQMMLLSIVDPDWGGLLPAIWLFDRKGTLAASLYGANALEQATAKLGQMQEKTRTR